MGQAKREQERLDSLRAEADVVLVKAGALVACEFHKDILIDQCDSEANDEAYGIGTNMVKAGKIDGTREEFIAAIDSALADSYDDCPHCRRALKDD